MNWVEEAAANAEAGQDAIDTLAEFRREQARQAALLSTIIEQRTKDQEWMAKIEGALEQTKRDNDLLRRQIEGEPAHVRTTPRGTGFGDYHQRGGSH